MNWRGLMNVKAESSEQLTSNKTNSTPSVSVFEYKFSIQTVFWTCKPKKKPPRIMCEAHKVYTRLIWAIWGNEQVHRLFVIAKYG